jgi:hypothetical protein
MDMVNESDRIYLLRVFLTVPSSWLLIPFS